MFKRKLYSFWVLYLDQGQIKTRKLQFVIIVDQPVTRLSWLPWLLTRVFVVWSPPGSPLIVIVKWSLARREDPMFVGQSCSVFLSCWLIFCVAGWCWQQCKDGHTWTVSTSPSWLWQLLDLEDWTCPSQTCPTVSCSYWQESFSHQHVSTLSQKNFSSNRDRTNKQTMNQLLKGQWPTDQLDLDMGWPLSGITGQESGTITGTHHVSTLTRRQETKVKWAGSDSIHKN